jgi:hypothetical protein
VSLKSLRYKAMPEELHQALIADEEYMEKRKLKTNYHKENTP